MTIWTAYEQYWRRWAGQTTIDVLAAAPGIKLAAIFAPEHGIFWRAGPTESGQHHRRGDWRTRIFVVWRHGRKRRPSVEILKTLDAVCSIFRMRSAFLYLSGKRWATCWKQRRKRIPSDRAGPAEPVNGSFVQGNMSQAEFASFTNYHPTPIRHGMTLGELAQMYNVERKIGARLR